MTTTTGPPSRAELQSQRQDEILRLVRERGRVEVTTLAEQFDVTTETIRRDLSGMQKRKLLRRVHGAAEPWQAVRYEPSISARHSQQVEEKRRIVTAALDELPPEGTIMMDAGSTTSLFAGYFPPDLKLRVVTNSLLIAPMLAEHDSLRVIVLGGTVRPQTASMVDHDTVETVRRMSVDVLFMGTDGLTPERGFTTPFTDEAAVKQAMIASARRVIALVDSTKFGNDHFVRFADLTDIDTLITDTGASDADVAALEAGGLHVVRV